MVSLLTGPIPPYPHYSQSGGSTYVNLPVPRVRPEGQEYARQAQGSVGMLLVEGHQVPKGFRRTKNESKNYMNENVRKMRQIQRETKHRESTGNKPVKALWKSSKFDDVMSKVSADLQCEPLPPRPHTAHYLQAHSRTGWSPSPRPRSAEPGANSELTVPKAATARDFRLLRRDIDFVNLNGRCAKNATIQRCPSLTALDELRKKKEDDSQNYKRGVVPQYLVNRRKQWDQAERERKANEPDPDMPEGHRAMPSDERLATLEKLQTTEQELMAQLQSLPVRTDTLRMRTQKEALDRKLAEVGEAIRIFSRPKVFIKLDT